MTLWLARFLVKVRECPFASPRVWTARNNRLTNSLLNLPRLLSVRLLVRASNNNIKPPLSAIDGLFQTQPFAIIDPSHRSRSFSLKNGRFFNIQASGIFRHL
jgi:hypothetical protein